MYNLYINTNHVQVHTLAVLYVVQEEKNALDSRVHVLTAARESAPQQQTASKAARKRSKGASSSTVTSPAQQVCPLLHCPSRHFVCCVARDVTGARLLDRVCVAYRVHFLKQLSDSLHIRFYFFCSLSKATNADGHHADVQTEVPEAQLSLDSNEAPPEDDKTPVVDTRASPGAKGASQDISEVAGSEAAASLAALNPDDATASSTGGQTEGDGWSVVKSSRRLSRQTTGSSSKGM